MTATDQLAAIEARANAATEGPWGAYAGCIRQERSWRDPSAVVVDYDGIRPSIPNALFIAHARTDVPALLALIREQAAAIERVRAEADSFDELASDASYNGTEAEMETWLSAAVRIRAAAVRGEG